jgi:predicted dehydrogenase
MAIISPAKSHPEVVIAAIAARDEKKGQAYAKKHGIPVVHKSYQGPSSHYSTPDLQTMGPNICLHDMAAQN